MKSLFTIALCLTALPALAETAPKPGSHDARVTYATYQEGQVYRINTRLRNVTLVELGTGEQIQSIAIGDLESFKIDKLEREYANLEEQDWLDSVHLYQQLESEVLPAFYDRGSDGIPHSWLKWSKAAIATVAPVFSTRRMVKDYANRLYMPAAGVVKG